MWGREWRYEDASTSEWSTILLPTKVRLILETCRYLSLRSEHIGWHLAKDGLTQGSNWQKALLFDNGVAPTKPLSRPLLKQSIGIMHLQAKWFRTMPALLAISLTCVWIKCEAYNTLLWEPVSCLNCNISILSVSNMSESSKSDNYVQGGQIYKFLVNNFISVRKYSFSPKTQITIDSNTNDSRWASLFYLTCFLSSAMYSLMGCMCLSVFSSYNMILFIATSQWRRG